MRNYRGVAALIIVSSLGAVLVIGITGVALAGRSLSDNGTKALIAIGGALVGALVGYLAVKRNGNGRSR